jgi:5-methylcytosine-specific restriction endonuclease McrA
MDHIALYGNVSIGRSFCQSCRAYAFVLEGRLQCCGAEAEFYPSHKVRVSQPDHRRRRLPASLRKLILESQDYRCLYCGQRFGSIVQMGSRVVVLSVRWDHVDPYCYSQNNTPSNLVAACQFCNAWKSGLSFQTIEEISDYVGAKWSRILHVRPVRKALPQTEAMAEVLQPTMPGSTLESTEPPPQDLSEELEGRGVGGNTRDWKRVVIQRAFPSPPPPDTSYPLRGRCLQCRCHYRIWNPEEWEWWRCHPDCLRKWRRRQLSHAHGHPKLRHVWSRACLGQSPTLGRPRYLPPPEWMFWDGEGI